MMQGESGSMGGMMDKGMMDKGMMCKCPHHKIVPLMIFIIGLLFFLNVLNVLTTSALNMLWPIALMIVGFMKMMSRTCKCCGGGHKC